MVEERLRQSDIRLRQAELRANEAEAKLEKSLKEIAVLQVGEEQRQHTVDRNSGQAESESPLFDKQSIADHSEGRLGHEQSSSQGTATRPSEYHIEEPPADDFSWNEQAVMHSPLLPDSPGAGDAGSPTVLDGMASLSVVDAGTGYLGVASGASMLKLMLDGDGERKLAKPRTGIPRNTHSDPEQLGWVSTPVYWQRNTGMVDLDTAIDAYFSCYHLAYPIVHEPSFRAQYAQVIDRPDGSSWNALAYIVGAIGIFSTATASVTQDLDLFEASRANISIASLESGNLTLVQTLTLMSNYLQKRNKPNSGYNYLGLALHMAISLGLHKEFSNWRIAPLAMEIRRRTWWTLYAFFSGAMITFGRPVTWPSHGIEVALPLNIDDRDLTHASLSLPPPKKGLTPYSAVASQARFHLATNDIYARIISSDFPSATELLQLDKERIETWHSIWSDDAMNIPERYRLPRMIMNWRFRNFRIIMFRFHLIKHVLRSREVGPQPTNDPATQEVIDRCLTEAEASIASIHGYWHNAEHNVMASWYGLYFIFQASMIPTIMLRNNPNAPQADTWRTQLHLVLTVLESMHFINAASKECRELIIRLCGGFLATNAGIAEASLHPVEESPETQLSGLQGMMWPGVHGTETDTFMQDQDWTTFLINMEPGSLDLPFNHDQFD
ncbi:hypothetical protein CBER1_00716 [Cercospora berteroae]|uniref:Xylanolytic transcriptional activator regulatory domain-containing protein n=1 Tax=Cercospora berteroae TaxID=357750 RepID=A0A2S6C998_9PEZI|nr:hypothetical protein CBER1_00716 [Cercospora berteroae]